MYEVVSQDFLHFSSSVYSTWYVTDTDADETSDWAAEDIAMVYELGLVKGPDGSFAPKAGMTRAEGATIIYNLLDKLELLD